MFFKKFLNQPNLVGTVLIALMVFSGFVYAFAFDGFNVETATGGEVEAWLAAAGGGGSGSDSCSCGFTYCPANNGNTCSNCTSITSFCKTACTQGGIGTCNCLDNCSNAGKVTCQINPKTKSCKNNP